MPKRNPFIKLLRSHHRLTRPEVQTAVGILLHRGGSVWWLRHPLAFFTRNVINRKWRLAINLGQYFLNGFVIRQRGFFTVFAIKRCRKLITALFELTINRPVFFGLKVANRLFSLDDQV